jgi:ubiquinone biosynthesis protein
VLTRGSLRLFQIARVVLRWRLDALLEGSRLERRLALLKPFVPTARAEVADLPRGARLRLALQELGPIFVKFGQILSTRRDLVPPDIADELAQLQDRVAPFDGELARAAVEKALGRAIDTAYCDFDPVPLASASIAQVHAARLKEADGSAGREVVIKVLRPQIEKRIAGDIALLRSVATLLERTHPNADKIRPNEVVSEIEVTLKGELDLQREGANASLLRRNWLNSDDLYVPEVFWTHTSERVLTLERVRGIPSDDIAALDAAGIDRAALAAKGVRVFYTQVFRDNFFHADAHPATSGSMSIRREHPPTLASSRSTSASWASCSAQISTTSPRTSWRSSSATTGASPSCTWKPAGCRATSASTNWKPRRVRFASPTSPGRWPRFPSVRCCSSCSAPAQRYELTIQPQLILLQKTLLNIEGVAPLDPKLDIWAVARPVLETILRERYSPRQLAREFRKRLPELITRAPDMPRLLHDWLAQQVNGQHSLQMRSDDIAQLARIAREAQRQVVYAILGSGLLIVAAVLYALEAGGPRFFGVSAAVWIAGLGALGAFLAAWPRRATRTLSD